MAYQIKRYRMDFDGKGISAAGIFLGAALLFRIVYYFGFMRFFDAGVAEILFWLVLPGLLELGAIALLRAVRFNAPGVYGIFGAVECFLLVVMCFGYGSILRTILGILAYLACGGLIFTCSAGWLSKEIASFMFVLTCTVRILAFELPGLIRNFRHPEVLLSLAGMCVLLGLASLTFAIKLPQKKNEETPVE